MMLIVGIGLFVILGITLLIVDAIRRLTFLTFALSFSTLLFLLFSYVYFIVPMREPVFQSLGFTAIFSVLIAFSSTGAYWIQRKYLIDQENSKKSKEEKRAPGQYY